jgi:hypothetical protein
MDKLPRFWAKVAIKGEEDCWIWQGAILPNGYGYYRLGSSMQYTHRIAFAVSQNTRPKLLAGLVLHSCNVRACCNPRHLRLGTYADNNRQAKEEGRTRPGFTFKPPPNKVLSSEAVAELKAMRAEGRSGACLAAIFGIQRDWVYKICNGAR